MSAERLCQAAALLRERAERTTRNAAWTEGHFWVEDYDPNDPSGQTGMQVEIGGMLADGDAAFYALMAPPLALALAEFLEQHESIHSVYDCNWEPCAALALADAILGDAS